MVETIQRTIHFYRITLKNNGVDVDIPSVFSVIDSYPIGSDERYYHLNDGNKLSMYVDSQVIPIKARLGTKRVKGLPSIERRGVTSLLDMPDDAGLYEPIHFMIFDQNILVAESNFYGPRITTLRTYLSAKLSDQVDEIKLVPIMNSDFMDIISNVGDVRKFRLKIHRNAVRYLEELNDSLFSAFNSAKEVSDCEDIEIIFSARRRSRNTIQIPSFEEIRNWLSNPEVKENIEELKIKAIDTMTEETREFDLLQEYVIAKRDVVRIDDLHKSVSSEDMYRVIQESYHDLRPTL